MRVETDSDSIIATVVGRDLTRGTDALDQAVRAVMRRYKKIKVEKTGTEFIDDLVFGGDPRSVPVVTTRRPEISVAGVAGYEDRLNLVLTDSQGRAFARITVFGDVETQVRTATWARALLLEHDAAQEAAAA